MRISADFTVIPDPYSKHAPEGNLVAGTPVVSFPFYIDQLAPSAAYLHWELVDPDSIPVCGFEWIHWAVANVPVDALMYDFNDSHALAIPADFSRTLPTMIPEALQGRTSAASKLVNSKDPAVFERYNGPTPPDQDHDYYLHVWASDRPLKGLRQGFWLNALLHAVRDQTGRIDQDGVFLTGRV